MKDFYFLLDEESYVMDVITFKMEGYVKYSSTHVPRDILKGYYQLIGDKLIKDENAGKMLPAEEVSTHIESLEDRLEATERALMQIMMEGVE